MLAFCWYPYLTTCFLLGCLVHLSSSIIAAVPNAETQLEPFGISFRSRLNVASVIILIHAAGWCRHWKLVVAFGLVYVLCKIRSALCRPSYPCSASHQAPCVLAGWRGKHPCKLASRFLFLQLHPSATRLLPLREKKTSDEGPTRRRNNRCDLPSLLSSAFCEVWTRICDGADPDSFDARRSKLGARRRSWRAWLQIGRWCSPLPPSPTGHTKVEKGFMVACVSRFKSTPDNRKLRCD